MASGETVPKWNAKRKTAISVCGANAEVTGRGVCKCGFCGSYYWYARKPRTDSFLWRCVHTIAEIFQRAGDERLRPSPSLFLVSIYNVLNTVNEIPRSMSASLSVASPSRWQSSRRVAKAKAGGWAMDWISDIRTPNPHKANLPEGDAW